MKKLALIGENVTFSKSTALHTEIANKNGREIKYDLISLPRIEFDGAIEELIASYDGLNVTMPYKKDIIPYLDCLSIVAKKLGVVNTVVKSSGKLYGDNTDVYGIKRSLDEHGIILEGKKALIIGSGATACSFAYVLQGEGAKISFLARNANAVEEICNRLNIDVGHCEKTSNASDRAYYIIINCTPIGSPTFGGVSPLEGEYSAEVLYDCVYEPTETPFLKSGGNYTLKINGMEMLRYQAEKAQDLFFEI